MDNIPLPTADSETQHPVTADDTYHRSNSLSTPIQSSDYEPPTITLAGQDIEQVIKCLTEKPALETLPVGICGPTPSQSNTVEPSMLKYYLPPPRTTSRLQQLTIEFAASVDLGRISRAFTLAHLENISLSEMPAPSFSEDAPGITESPAVSPAIWSIQTFLAALRENTPLRRLHIQLGDPNAAGAGDRDHGTQDIPIQDLLEPLISRSKSSSKDPVCSGLQELRVVCTGPGIVTVDDEGIEAIGHAFPNLEVLHLDCEPRALVPGQLWTAPYEKYRPPGPYESFLTLLAFVHLASKSSASSKLTTLCLPAFMPVLDFRRLHTLRESRKIDPLRALETLVICRDLKATCTFVMPPILRKVVREEYARFLDEQCPRLNVLEALQAIPRECGETVTSPAVRAWREVLGVLCETHNIGDYDQMEKQGA